MPVRTDPAPLPSATEMGPARTTANIGALVQRRPRRIGLFVAAAALLVFGAIALRSLEPRPDVPAAVIKLDATAAAAPGAALPRPTLAPPGEPPTRPAPGSTLTVAPRATVAPPVSARAAKRAPVASASMPRAATALEQPTATTSSVAAAAPSGAAAATMPGRSVTIERLIEQRR